MMAKEKADDAAVQPTVCPYCKSTRIAAPAGTTGAATYWRCDGCGEMWNVSRQTKRARPSRWDRY